MKDKRLFHRWNLLIPTILFVLMFVLVSSVLTLVFLRAAEVSRSARELTDAVQLCRSEAEYFRAEPENLPETAYFDENYRQTRETDGVYRLTRSYADSDAAGGKLETCVFTVFSMDGRELYRLEAEAFRMEG